MNEDGKDLEKKLGVCVAVRVTHRERPTGRVVNNVPETEPTKPEYYFATSVAVIRGSYDERDYKSIERVPLEEVPHKGFYHQGLRWAVRQTRDNEDMFNVSATTFSQKKIDRLGEDEYTRQTAIVNEKLKHPSKTKGYETK